MTRPLHLPLIAIPAPPAPVTFTGVRADFRRMMVRGALLELVTFGFYRFWLATGARQHLWSNTVVDGDAPEYTGTAKELLVGFMFALAILAPGYLAYFLAGLEAERLQAYASFPLIAFVYLFSQFARYRARRYQLARTVWRGVRFGMTGSGLGYMWRAALWTLLTVLTLGLALPWRQAALERYKMQHTTYGDLQGRFVATGGELFQRGWTLWLAIGVVVALVFAAAATEMPLLVLASVALALLTVPFAYARFKAVEWQWWLSGLRMGQAGMGQVRLESDLERNALTGLYWKVIGWSALIFTLLFAWIGGIVALATMSQTGTGEAAETARVTQDLSVMLPIMLGYLVAVMAFGVVTRVYFTRDIWQRVASSVSVHNLVMAETISIQGPATSALGEGLANSLDIGAF